MNTLHDLQSEFQSFLLHRREDICAQVVGTDKASAEQRLAIYYDAYRLRLLEALDSNYPVLHGWTGDEEFEKLGLAYLAAHPSTHFSIRYFGHELARFLAASEAYRDKPFLSEMAQFEWAMSEAFDALDSALVRLEDMAAMAPESWPGLRFKMQDSVHRLNLAWNVPVIWKAIDAEQAPEEPQRSEYPRSWLLWRQDLKTYFRSLSVDEAWALDAAANGGTFAMICEGLCEWIDAQHVAAHAAGLLKQWILDGLISGIDTK
ncbi:MAG: DNA-binding domain-containing protein [Pseudomonadota bacterium]